MSEPRDRKQRRALATICGAGACLLSLFCISLRPAWSQSASADLEAVEAVEVPLRIEKGPIVGKIELRPLPTELQSSPARRQPAVRATAPSTGSASGKASVASIYSATVDSDAEAKKRSISEFERQLKNPQPDKQQPRTRQAENTEKIQKIEPSQSTAHTKEFNWLSDEPVSKTAEKYAEQAKREQAAGAKTTKAVKPKATMEKDEDVEAISTENTSKPVEKQSDSNSKATAVARKIDPPVDAESVKTGKKPHCSGVADFYARRFHGLKTASGQIHDKEKFTAAHRTLPFGTKLKVVNRNTGKSCVVTVNDRGPFTPTRVIDLSEAAAKELGLITAKSRMVDCYLVENP